MKKITGIILLLLAAIILAACQTNYIRDVQGGTVSPSSTAELTGVETQ
ncbi:TPA: colicin release lysis protein [Escherichia coli]|nr:colicin release lysis protein [Escherichia coli]